MNSIGEWTSEPLKNDMGLELKKVAFIGNRENIEKVFLERHMAHLEERVDLARHVISSVDMDEHLPLLKDVEVLISTWGMPLLTSAQLDACPKLKLVLYAAGDVRPFAQPLISRGITVVSAWRANAIPVAEFTLAHILLAGKGYLRDAAEYKAVRRRDHGYGGPGNCGNTIAILGAGAIGRNLIGLLKPFQLNVIVYDPFLSRADAEALDVEQVSLEDAFSRGFVVTNHLANNQATRQMIDGKLLLKMPLGATFINTGRGQTINQDEFLSAFTDRPDLTAILDVTDPEPLPETSPIWDMANVFVSTHIAGAKGNELSRLADLCMEELDRYVAGEPLQHVVPVTAIQE